MRAYPFRMSSSGIPSMYSTSPSIDSTSMTSKSTHSVPLQGFQFGSGNVPPSNPSLNLGSMPFHSHAQNINPFQGN